LKTHLKRGEPCPIHNGDRFCECHPQRKKKKHDFRRHGPVIRDIRDDHPRGYIEICSDYELERRKKEMLHEHNRCYICGERFNSYRQVTLEHLEPAGKDRVKDDHRDNLEIAHILCNIRKGSQRLTEPRCEVCGVLRPPHLLPSDERPAAVNHPFIPRVSPVLETSAGTEPGESAGTAAHPTANAAPAVPPPTKEYIN